MSAGCVRWLLNHAARTACGLRPGYQTPASRFLQCSERLGITPASWSWSPFCTVADDTQQAPKKNSKDHGAKAKIGNVGRMIPHQRIQLLSETGEDLGVMHRVNVIKIMDSKSMKLVLVSGNKDPPVYQLMSGKQIYEEQVKAKLQEKEKPKGNKASVLVKELTFSCGIGSNDFATKMKQVRSWLEKKHHIKLTLRAGRGQSVDKLDTVLEEMVQQLDIAVGFVSPPKVKAEGKRAACIIRLASAKEMAQMKKKKEAAAAAAAPAPQSDDSSSGSVPSSSDSAEGPVQQ